MRLSAGVNPQFSSSSPPHKGRTTLKNTSAWVKTRQIRDMMGSIFHHFCEDVKALQQKELTSRSTLTCATHKQDSEVSTEWSSVPLKISGRRNGGNSNFNFAPLSHLTSHLYLQLTSFVRIVLSQPLCNHKPELYIMVHVRSSFCIPGRRVSVIVTASTRLNFFYWSYYWQQNIQWKGVMSK